MISPPTITSRHWIALLAVQARRAPITVERLPERDDPSDLDRWDDEGGRPRGTPTGDAVSSWEPTPVPRFGSRDRFSLAPAGRIAEASYRSHIVTSRARPGRRSFDAARSAWATSLGLEPDDGVYLGELLPGAVNLSKIVAALTVCGKKRTDAMAALARLMDAGLILRAERP